MARVTEPFTVAAVGYNCELFELDRNIAGACAMVEEAAAAGAKIIVLPELGLSGVDYPDLESWLPYMDTIPGKATDSMSRITAKYGCYVAIGMAEVDPTTGMTYNSGALVGPQGLVGKYRKTGINYADVTAFRPGNAGYPVFATEYGNIAMFICFDDTFWEPARVAALKGADIICHMVSSGRGIASGALQPLIDATNHSTIAAGQHWNAWNGVALISCNRNNAESNPLTGTTVWYGGASSIWGPDGTLLAREEASTPDVSPATKGQIIYATLDPAQFDNAQRSTLAQRRPALYNNLTFLRCPIDMFANMTPHEVTAHALQYPITPGDVAANILVVDGLIAQLASTSSDNRLVVLPAFSFTGMPATADQARAWAEAEMGRTTQALSNIAIRSGAHVIGSHVERDGDDLFHSAVLIGPDGTFIGRYRQTHLDDSMRAWATAGDDIPVFTTSIGQIGMLACGDVRFPEAAGVLEVARADIIAIPSAWDGSYGGWVNEPEGLFTHAYPVNAMVHWYYTAKCTQAFTVAANPVGGAYQGSSGVFTLTPVTGDPAIVGSTDGTEIVTATFTTLGPRASWINQQFLIDMRRADLAVPLILDVDSPIFTQWRDAPGFDISGWASYAQ